MNLPPRDWTSGPVVRPAPEMAMRASQGSMKWWVQRSKLRAFQEAMVEDTARG
jgi:hypothetical protein